MLSYNIKHDELKAYSVVLLLSVLCKLKLNTIKLKLNKLTYLNYSVVKESILFCILWGKTVIMHILKTQLLSTFLSLL